MNWSTLDSNHSLCHNFHNHSFVNACMYAYTVMYLADAFIQKWLKLHSIYTFYHSCIPWKLNLGDATKSRSTVWAKGMLPTCLIQNITYVWLCLNKFDRCFKQLTLHSNYTFDYCMRSPLLMQCITDLSNRMVTFETSKQLLTKLKAELKTKLDLYTW